MEKKAQLYEIIIKLVFAITAFICSVFVVKNAFFMFPLFTSFSCNETQLYHLIYNTQFGDILNDVGVVINFSFSTLVKGFIGFLNNIEWVGLFFLVLTIALLLLRFMFIKWTLIRQYLKLSLVSIVLYILKFALFGICFSIFYKSNIRTMSLAFVVGTSMYLAICIIQLFVFSLLIVKFIFNISIDIKYYLSH